MTDPKPLSVVTGGTSGIGLAVAKRLIKTDDLALIYRSDRDQAEKALHELKAIRPECQVRSFAGNLGDSKDAKRVFEEVENWDSRVPTNLVNCAGRSHISFLVTDPPEVAATVFADNFHSMVNSSHFFARKMFTARTGRIVNISSIAATLGPKGHALYSAAKSAVEAFTRVTSAELIRRGIYMNCVRPGLVRVERTEKLIESVERLERQLTPLDDVVDAICRLLSPEEKVYGQIISVDGGPK